MELTKKQIKTIIQVLNEEIEACNDQEVTDYYQEIISVLETQLKEVE